MERQEPTAGSKAVTRMVAVVIRGRVQGVGYRMWTRDEARRLGLSGHVRNRADGAVEAVFAGSEQAVGTMIENCRKGPRGARVDDVDVADSGPAIPQPGFTIFPG